MQVWDVIKGVRFKQLHSVLLFFFKHPFFFISTVKATFDVLKISQREFPNTHGFHNKANAFRHALWNIFIAKQCSLFSRIKRGRTFLECLTVSFGNSGFERG